MLPTLPRLESGDGPGSVPAHGAPPLCAAILTLVIVPLLTPNLYLFGSFCGQGATFILALITPQQTFLSANYVLGPHSPPHRTLDSGCQDAGPSPPTGLSLNLMPRSGFVL